MFEGTILDPAGPISQAQRQLLFDAVGLMLIIILPVFVFTALIVWRYRARNPTAAYTPDWDRSRAFEIGIWFMPLVIVVLLWGMVWHRTHVLDPYRPLASSQPPLVVQAVALDWQWLFIYPAENVASLNRLVFPAGRPLSFEITSATVMNSLSVPALGGQIYAMAGMRTRLNLMADAPGTFIGRNTQFSGNGFAAQNFSAEATTPEGFDAFLTEARSGAVALDGSAYKTIAAPTTDGPARLFAPVEAGLFESIIASYSSMPATNAHAGHTP